MRKIILSAALVLGLSGCGLNSQFVTAVDSAWDVIGPRYVEYVQRDPTLDDDSKATRLRTAQLLSEVIAEAKQ